MRTSAILAVLALGLGVPAPPAAAATDHRVLTVNSSFLPTDLVVAAGDSVTLTNLDQIVHNLVSDDQLPGGGGPYFASRTIGFAESSPVFGVPALPRSFYTFTCTVHPEMVGTLRVV